LPNIIEAYKILYNFLGPEHPSTKNSKESIIKCGGDPEAVEREVMDELGKEGETGENK
jgi:hypothetical protein